MQWAPKMASQMMRNQTNERCKTDCKYSQRRGGVPEAFSEIILHPRPLKKGSFGTMRLTLLVQKSEKGHAERHAKINAAKT